MANPTPTGAPRVPPHWSSLAAHFARLTSEQLSDIATLAIDELDTREPDTDLEATFTEDDFCEHHSAGAGCPVSDPGGEKDELLTTLPIYGDDQSLGPINEMAAVRTRYKQMIGEGAC